MHDSPDHLVRQLRWRYATQKFDPTRAITPALWDALEQSLVLTASSFGLQPWKFVVVTDAEVRKQLVACSYGQSQVRDASHVVVFAIPKRIDAAHVDKHIEQMVKTREIEARALERYRRSTVGYMEKLPEDRQADWAARQVYIALGAFMTACAMVHVDTCPMEGIDPQKYDELLGIADEGYATVVVAAAGYRAADDKHASHKKVRFDHADVIRRI